MRLALVKTIAAGTVVLGTAALTTAPAMAAETATTTTPATDAVVVVEHPTDCQWATNDEVAHGKIILKYRKVMPFCGEAVTAVKVALAEVGVKTDVDYFTKTTKKLVERYDVKNQRNGLKASGKTYGTVDKKTWNLLMKQSASSGLKKDCLKPKGPKMVCANQKLRSLWVTKNGKILAVFDARFGAPGDTATRNGNFRVFCKHKVDRSEEYHVNMYNFLCFSGGQGIHGSVAIIDNPKAAYAEPGSHGCIGLSMKDSQWMWNNIPQGTKVHVYAG